MITSLSKFASAALAAVWFSTCLAAEPAKPQGTLIDFAAEASRNAANDLARATAFAEATDPNPGEVAKRVNGAIAAALQTAKAYSSVKTRSGTTSTYPVYAKGGARIDGWRMRSELLLESRDSAALAELIGKLQTSLGVTQIMLTPAPDTRRKAEDEAMLDAIAAFRARAKLVADALGKPYRIRQMAISSSGRPPIVPVMRAAAMAEAAPPVFEPGEASIGVVVNGQIELAD